MTGPIVLSDPREIPLGSHCVCFHATKAEAAGHAAEFLAGTPDGQSARFWVEDGNAAAFYARAAGDHAPQHVGCVAVLGKEQVEPDGGALRPVPDVREFIENHPEGVSAGADTISAYWTGENLTDHLEYERWFDVQPRENSRFICPYDLRTVPPDHAISAMRGLGASHTHVVLSGCTDEGARLLQLFVFPSMQEIPSRLHPALGWAVKNRLVTVDEPTGELMITPLGEQLVRDWTELGTADW